MTLSRNSLCLIWNRNRLWCQPSTFQRYQMMLWCALRLYHRVHQIFPKTTKIVLTSIDVDGPQLTSIRLHHIKNSFYFQASLLWCIQSQVSHGLISFSSCQNGDSSEPFLLWLPAYKLRVLQANTTGKALLYFLWKLLTPWIWSLLQCFGFSSLHKFSHS